MPERATVLNRSEKSSRGRSSCQSGAKGRTRRGAGRHVAWWGKASEAGQPGCSGRGEGEADSTPGRDEATLARPDQEGLGRGLLEKALARENLVLAWKRVKANKGSAGVDGLTIAETAEYLKTHWSRIREELHTGRYRPQPVRRVQIPKSGGGMRELGIPTVTDRLIQQALLQVLQPLIDPTFSDYSYGFRPGRRAHDAVLQAQRYVQDGYRIVVDLDLEKFFDRVNHDVLMDRLAKRIDDKAVLRLIRQYLQAGIMAHGVVIERYEGTPQGGPLSPLLANVLLDEVDRALEQRGHRFVRYADDSNVYVRSHKAGERVLAGLRPLVRWVAPEGERSEDRGGTVSLAASFSATACGGGPGGEVKRAPSRARRWTPSSNVSGGSLAARCGRSLPEVAEQLRGYLPGWKAYFRLGANAAGVPRARRMAAAPPARHPTQALATGNDDVSGVAGSGSEQGTGGEGGGQCPSLVAQQLPGIEPPAADCLLRPYRCPPALMTSTSRTARCGTACRVAREGSDQR